MLHVKELCLRVLALSTLWKFSWWSHIVYLFWYRLLLWCTAFETLCCTTLLSRLVARHSWGGGVRSRCRRRRGGRV